MKGPLLCAALMTACAAPVWAVDRNDEVLWLGWFHNHQLNDRWQWQSDIQVRSEDQVEAVRQVLIRPGVSYRVNANWSVGAGYVFVENTPTAVVSLQEHRPWQQVVWQSDAQQAVRWTHRFRLEQRFLETNAGDVDSVRLRHLMRAQTALPGATGGQYMAVHNEIFLALSARDELTGRTFDQTRTGVLVGWPLTPKFTLETGYLAQYVRARNTDTLNHVLQLNLVSRF